MSNLKDPSEAGMHTTAFREQAAENRNFDKQIVVHQEKISMLEKTASDLEERLREVEKFRWKTTGMGYIGIILLTGIMQILIKKFF